MDERVIDADMSGRAIYDAAPELVARVRELLLQIDL
jgi:hypothetical protein